MYLQLQNLTKQFDNITAVNDMNVNIKKGNLFLCWGLVDVVKPLL